ncbi:MAG: hypothetical protein HQK83_20080, partial [Fibrobacteria bacterium]|nr:hypothetical protein [Fibrobacteria bacterium]
MNNNTQHKHVTSSKPGGLYREVTIMVEFWNILMLLKQSLFSCRFVNLDVVRSLHFLAPLLTSRYSAVPLRLLEVTKVGTSILVLTLISSWMLTGCGAGSDTAGTASGE